MKYVIVFLLGMMPALAKDLGPILYNSCQYCHGKLGDQVYVDVVPAINQLDKQALIAMLTLYKKGEINTYGFGPIMMQQMKNIPEDKIPTLAKYITKLKKEQK